MADPQTVRPDAGGGRTIRALGYLSLALLALITAIVSYQHGLQVVRASGTDGNVAYLIPLVADLLIFASSLALLDASQRGHRYPPLAVVSLGFGVIATIVMNVAAGWAHGVSGALVSALAPLALVFSYETLMGMIRRARQQDDAEPAEPAQQEISQVQPPFVELVEVAAPAPRTLAEAVVAAKAQGLSVRAISEGYEITRYRVDAILKAAEGGGDEAEPAGEDLVPSLNGQHASDVEQPE